MGLCEYMIFLMNSSCRGQATSRGKNGLGLSFLTTGRAKSKILSILPRLLLVIASSNGPPELVCVVREFTTDNSADTDVFNFIVWEACFYRVRVRHELVSRLWCVWAYSPCNLTRRRNIVFMSQLVEDGMLCIVHNSMDNRKKATA